MSVHEPEPEKATEIFSSNSYAHVHLTSKEIIKCREELNGLIIAPFDKAKAKGVGYNLSLSEMIYSISKKRLVPICREVQENFFYLHPHETILALSYESVETNSCIAGSFHSRVRIAAQGIGCISTTLDPKWCGMLLFSLNNPTKRKIKIVLSVRGDDGIMKPSPIITLVTWAVPGSEEDDALLLKMDNPPMRSDIWSEITSKSIRFFHNRQHIQFRKLVEAITAFRFTPSESIQWTNQLSQLLTELRVAIEANKCEKDIQSVLVRIRAFGKETLSFIYNANNVPKVLQEDLEKLYQILDPNFDSEKSLVDKASEKEYIEIIDLTEREIQYQSLCDQVYQIHREIQKYVPEAWHKNKLAHIRKIFSDNIILLIATIVTIVLLIVNHYFESNLCISIIAAILPFIFSVLHKIYDQK